VSGVLKAIGRAIRDHQRFVVAAHDNPDGDAVGSTLALARVIENLGGRAVRFNADPVPQVYRFLDGADRVAAAVDPGFDVEVLFVLDCSEPSRLGPQGEALIARAGLVINLDHHLTSGRLGRLQVVDTAAAATGVLLWRLFTAAGIEFDRPAAEGLYVAVLTDTGSFRHSNTNQEAFLLAADLVARGVDPARVAREAYAHTRGRLALIGQVLSTLTFRLDGRLALVKVTPDMFARTDTSAVDLDGLIELPRSAVGVEVAAMLRVLDADTVKVSLRSRGGVNVAALAERYGGGGHHNAAGLKLSSDLAGAEELIAAEVERMMDTRAQRASGAGGASR
jgi:phosphoesterase RecJ-like protein